mgnify:CR=1 FL=1
MVISEVPRPMTLSPTYELEIGPSPQSIEDYAVSTETQFHQLLDANPSEQHIQNFLEQNPALVPGARTPGSPSGHSPLHNALITQPRLPGLRSKLPDFMWIGFHSLAWFPTLIEIERPDKQIFRSDGVPRTEFTQARNQLAQWRAWFSQPTNVLTFIREYGVPEDVARHRSMKLHMILIYGRRYEFEGDSVKSNQRSALVTGADEELMSFDRLRVDKDLRDAITIRCNGSGDYRAVAVPPTFTLGPTFADRLAHIRGLGDAIRQANIEAERVEFLHRRLEYWRRWNANRGVGIINGADCE